MSVIVERGPNPYRENVQGKANEPITVAGLLDRAEQILAVRRGGAPYPPSPEQILGARRGGTHAAGTGLHMPSPYLPPGARRGGAPYPPSPHPPHTLEAIYDRLEANAPRIAILGGSSDHPAHILDLETALRAAVRIWQQGGVPFYFGIPVLCDGTAQSNIGMGYSLRSRNLAAEMVVNQMEAHSYHGAFVISGCDKTPLGIASGLALLDRARQRRGDAPVFATFCPAHVLRGGTIPPDLAAELERVAERAEAEGQPEIAGDIRAALADILQCITNAAFQGVLTRARQEGLITHAEHKAYERQLAVHTCHPKGGICAFNGTGNSSRHVTSALGLAHPAVELLTEPPTAAQVNRAVDDLFTYVNRPEYSVSRIVAANFGNAVRIHSATGGSTNLMMHLVAAMIYAGCDISVWDIDRIRRNPPVPDLFDYSLSQGRDIFALARQCCAGLIRGMETVFYELLQQGIPMDLDAPTVTGTTWRERLADTTSLPASGVADNPVILSRPRRPFSGIEVLQGNFVDTAVVKVSGMSSEQIADFDDQVSVVLFFENEEQANAGLLDVRVLDRLKGHPSLSREKLLAMAVHNGRTRGLPAARFESLERVALFDRMVAEGVFKVVVVISGQGPQAFGMPEMFTPMHYINSNRALRKLAALISDGRYSGTSYGAAIGHVTPEAFNGGLIGLLETGDLVRVQLTNRRIDLIDPDAFVKGRLVPWSVDLRELRRELSAGRRERMVERQRQVVATHLMRDVTDASRGVVPLVVAEEAVPYRRGGAPYPP